MFCSKCGNNLPDNTAFCSQCGTPQGTSPTAVPPMYAVPPVNTGDIWGMQPNTFCLAMHLSQFAGCIVPGAGFVLPLIMWLTNKDNSPLVDQHGRVIFNWVISEFIYAFVSILLCFVIIGFIPLLAVVVCGIVFPIIGAVKANNGEIWQYPLSIPFFKV